MQTVTGSRSALASGFNQVIVYLGRKSVRDDKILIRRLILFSASAKKAEDDDEES